MPRFVRASFSSTLALAFVLAGCSQAPSGSRETAAALPGEEARASDVAEAGAVPAPPVTTTTRRTSVSVGGIVKTRTETVTTAPAAPPPEPVEPIRRTRPAQAGLLTAGDHDDLLNPELYADYAGKFLQAHGGSLPFVDTRTRVAVKLVDADGRPVPFARVDVERGQGSRPLRLVSAADGTASFYPRFDHVPARALVRVASSAGAATRTLDLADGSARRVAIALPGRAASVSALDLVLAIDTTGSMGDEMAYLQAELDSIVARLKRDAGQIDLRIGIVLYRDEGDDYVVRTMPLTGDIGTIRAGLAAQEAAGGGDTPEAVDRAVAAAGRMQWRAGAAKALLLVGDAPPHEEAIAPTLAATERLRSAGVQIVPVAASGVEDEAQYVMRTMAALTHGRYLFLTDDSGVGDPHAEPDLACYVVTRLDQLIGRVLAGIVEGRRIEPGPGEVIRTVGDYRGGRCFGSGARPGQA